MALTETAAHGGNVSKHLVHSHAHEQDVPGTVNLLAEDGDDTALGLALFPVPAQDPNDPLQWPNSKKTLILVVASVYSFLGSASLTGVSVYISLFSDLFGVSPTDASNLISYPNLCFGFGSLFLVPLYLKVGRRPVMLGTLVCFIVGLAASSRATTYAGLMAARCVHAFGAGVCEALPVQFVNDIFFLHERGRRIGYYTGTSSAVYSVSVSSSVCLCLASIAPLPAGYMLAAGYSWRLFFYVCLSFALATLVLAFFVVEETSYDRKAAMATEALTSEALTSEALTSASVTDKEPTLVSSTTADGGPLLCPRRKTFRQTLSLLGRTDRSASFFGTMLRSFSYLLVPQALWVITTYGANIGLGAFALGFTFPAIIMAPPYNWDVTQSGLNAVAPAIGFVAAIPFMASSDRLAAYLTRRNGGVREAEMQLGVLLVPMLVGPAGLLLYGLAAERQLAWPTYFVASALMTWSSYFYFTFTIAYAVDAHFANASEMLIAINVGKQAVSFAFGGAVLAWVAERGYGVVVGGIFSATLLANNLVVIVFLVWGKSTRRYLARSWLGRLHRDTKEED